MTAKQVKVVPISISSANCVAATGMSWSWVMRFAHEHNVPIWRVGTRKQLVAAIPLLAALERAAVRADASVLTFEDELAALERSVAEKLRS